MALFFFHAPVRAASIPVDGTTCTLADAIQAANTDAPVGGCSAGAGADTLTLSASVSLASAYQSSSNGLPVITSTLTIDGAGHMIQRVSSAGAFRLLEVGTAGRLTLTRVTLAGGNIASSGGGLYSSGVLTLTHSAIISNTAIGGGGGLALAAGSVARVENNTFSGNQADEGGGIQISGALTLTHNTFVNNTATTRAGGFIVMGTGTLNYRANLISGNSAPTAAEVISLNVPGVASQGYNLYGFDSDPGLGNSISFAPTDQVPAQPLAEIVNPLLTDNGAASGYVTLTHALVAGSPAVDSAVTSGFATDQRGRPRRQGLRNDTGAMEMMSVFLQGRDCLLADAIVAANEDAPSGTCPAGNGVDTLVLNNVVTLTTAYAADMGLPAITTTMAIEGNGNLILRAPTAPAFRLLTIGAAGHLTLTQVTVRGGNSDTGAGILNEGQLVVSNSTIDSNTANNEGGGLANTGTLTMTNSTLNDNTALTNGGALRNTGTATLLNSTVSGNSVSGGSGGGLGNTGTLTLINTTVTGNAVSGNGGGLVNSGTLTLIRSLISGNMAGGTGPEVQDNAGVINSNNYNLIGYSNDARSAGFTPSGTDLIPSVALTAVLNPLLGGYGGDTWTHALASGSPAIDAAGSTMLATDQRGRSRPEGAAGDIGAVEAVVNARLNGSECDLIDAIYAANRDSVFGGCSAGNGADLITLIDDVVLFDSRVGPAETGNGLPMITSTLTISGAGYTIRRVPTAPALSILGIGSTGVVTVTNIMITGGAGMGGILNGGELTLLNSTVYSNVSIAYAGGITSIGSLTVTNSTISQNTGFYAGGIASLGPNAKLTHNTVTDNSALFGAGGVLALGSMMTMTGNLVSGNRGGIIAEAAAIGPLASSYNLYGHANISGTLDITLDGTDIVPTVPITEIINTTLGDYGGDTWTYWLVASSPAIDAGGDSGLATDQRGVPRPSGTADDIGAVEYNAMNSAVSLPDMPSTIYAADPHAAYAAQSPAGVYTITATFRNITTPATSFYNVYFRVKQINHANGENYLLNADGGPGQVGAVLSVSNSALPGNDERWTLTEDLPVAFVIGLDERRQFTFKIDLFGQAEAVVGASDPASHHLGSFTFTVDPTEPLSNAPQRLFLPLITK
ncbi:MAG: hypothetical protein KF832_03210 [Caldilineaceae bacterium]|nr:hypothetical protein [Caldilineaceae bacterium]